MDQYQKQQPAADGRSHHDHHARPYTERSRLLDSTAQHSASGWGAIAGAKLGLSGNAEEEDDDESSSTKGRSSINSSADVMGADDVVPEENDDDRARLVGWRLGITLLSVWGTNACFAFNTTATATLSPQIASHFEHVELSSYIGSCFLLASVVFTPVFGGLTDHLSRPATMCFAGLLFGLGCLGTALSTSFSALLVARGLTGAGGAGILTLSSIITTDLVSLRERGYYQGLTMTVYGIAASVGGPLAGLLGDHWGWEAAFYVQIPPLVCTLAALWILLPRPAEHAAGRPSGGAAMLFKTLDLPGLALLFAFVGALLLGLSLHTSGLPWMMSVPLIGASVLALIAFSFVERTTEKRGGRVLVPWEVLRQRNVLFTCLSAGLTSLSNGAMSYNIPLYFSVVRSASSTSAGLHLLPQSIGLALGSLLAGYLIRSTGRSALLGIISLALPIASAITMARWNEHTPSWVEWVDISPAGLGYSSYLVTSLIAIISSVPKEMIPRATAISYLFRTLGGCLGVALFATLQQEILGRQLAARITGSGSKKIISNIKHSKTYLALLPPDLRAPAIDAYAISLKATFAATAAIGLLALLAAIPIEEHHLGDKSGPVGGGKHKARAEEAEAEEEGPLVERRTE